MKFKSLMLAAALFGLFSVAQAHTHLTKSVPEENSVVSEAPSQLMLHFSGVTHLTALTVQKEGEKEARKIDPLPQESAAEFTIPVSSLTAGTYTVNWRVVGNDNHVMSGALHFTVKPGK